MFQSTMLHLFLYSLLFLISKLENFVTCNFCSEDIQMPPSGELRFTKELSHNEYGIGKHSKSLHCCAANYKSILWWVSENLLPCNTDYENDEILYKHAYIYQVSSFLHYFQRIYSDWEVWRWWKSWTSLEESRLSRRWLNFDEFSSALSSPTICGPASGIDCDERTCAIDQYWFHLQHYCWQ